MTNPALGMSCRKLSEKEARSSIALRKYSPFRPMMLASLIGNAVSTATIIEKDSRESSAKPQWVYTVAGFVWLPPVLMSVMADACSMVALDQNFNLENINTADLDFSQWKLQRRFFWGMHGLSSIPTLLASFTSDFSDRWYWLGGAMVLPVIVDLLSRTIFYPDTFSPWHVTGGVVSASGQSAPGVLVTYRF
jgi:hypothetical protein